MQLGISKKFQDNLNDIDNIFSVSQTLKGLYIKALENVEKDSLPYSQRHRIETNIQGIENISTKSIKKEEEKNWGKLYGQAIVLIVSNAEQLLKDLFDNLVFSNINVVPQLGKINFSFDEIKNSDYKENPNFWRNLLKEKLYSESNPQEKLNFQNIESIRGIFKNYFNLKINLLDEDSKSILYFYQCRHLIVHNGGIVDNHFKKILSNQLNKYVEIGTILEINEEEYEKCKNVFINLFSLIEETISQSDLIYSEQINY